MRITEDLWRCRAPYFCAAQVTTQLPSLPPSAHIFLVSSSPSNLFSASAFSFASVAQSEPVPPAGKPSILCSASPVHLLTSLQLCFLSTSAGGSVPPRHFPPVSPLSCIFTSQFPSSALPCSSFVVWHLLFLISLFSFGDVSVFIPYSEFSSAHFFPSWDRSSGWRMTCFRKTGQNTFWCHLTYQNVKVVSSSELLKC